MVLQVSFLHLDIAFTLNLYGRSLLWLTVDDPSLEDVESELRRPVGPWNGFYRVNGKLIHSI